MNFYKKRNKKERVNLKTFEEEYANVIEDYKQDIQENEGKQTFSKKFSILSFFSCGVIGALSLLSMFLSTSAVLTVLGLGFGVIGVGVTLTAGIVNLENYYKYKKINQSLKENIKGQEDLLKTPKHKVNILENISEVSKPFNVERKLQKVAKPKESIKENKDESSEKVL